MAALLVLGGGCARLGFGAGANPDATSLDTGGGDASGRDGPARDATRDDLQRDSSVLDSTTDSAADPLSPFGTPQLVTELSSDAEEDDPSLTADMLEVYFNRSDDIYRSTRSSLTDTWGTPQLVAELSSTAVESGVMVFGDGLTIFLGSERSHPQAQGKRDIFVATRPSRDAPWGTPQLVAELSSVEDDSPGGMSPDQLTIFITSSRAGGKGGGDIYISTRASKVAPWAPPTPVVELNSNIHDGQPCATADLLVAYFDRSPFGATSNGDILVATRATVSDPFSTPVAVPGVNTSFREVDPWVSPDQHTIYFSSWRTGNKEIFFATR